MKYNTIIVSNDVSIEKDGEKKNKQLTYELSLSLRIKSNWTTFQHTQNLSSGGLMGALRATLTSNIVNQKILGK